MPHGVAEFPRLTPSPPLSPLPLPASLQSVNVRDILSLHNPLNKFLASTGILRAIFWLLSFLVFSVGGGALNVTLPGGRIVDIVLPVVTLSFKHSLRTGTLLLSVSPFKISSGAGGSEVDAKGMDLTMKWKLGDRGGIAPGDVR